MSKKQYVLLLAVALVAGLAGSAVSSYFVLSRGLIAQKLPSAPEPPKMTGEDLIAKYSGQSQPPQPAPSGAEGLIAKYSAPTAEPSATGPGAEDLLATYGAPTAAPTRAFVVWENSGRGRYNPVRTYETLEDCQHWEELYTAALAEHPNDVAIPASSFFAAIKNREISYICLPDSVNPNLGHQRFSELYDGNGKTRATLGHTDLETTRTGSTEKRPASSLVLFDKDGKVIWQAP